uniref:Uncharacterized protein n=1 Tax=Arundo donax TaxID=35708 RepID=A0A0A8YAT0_ARUDO
MVAFILEVVVAVGPS